MRFKTFITDWDETVTKVDTIKYVAEAAYLKKPTYQPPFSHFVDTYLTAYERFNLTQSVSTNIQEELNYQRNVKSVELSSVNEIEKLKLFKGLSAVDFQVVADRIDIHQEFVTTFRYCKQQNIPIVILSVNWSRNLIEAVLRLNAIDPKDVKIVVNEFDFDDGICSGNFRKDISIRTGYDKLQYIKSFGADIIYVGDSRTDLLSIIESKVGIIFKKESTMKTARSIGINVTNISDSSLSLSKLVYFANNWIEILNYLKSKTPSLE